MPIWRIPRVMAELGTTRSPTYEQIKAQLLPATVRIGPRAVGIPSHEVEAVIKARIAGASDEDIRRLVQRLHLQRKTAAAELLTGAAL